MSKDGKDLSNYISLVSINVQMYSVIAGFLFTTITLLVTLLPDPSHIVAQATLITLFVIFGLCLLQIVGLLTIHNYCVRVIPPLPKGFGKRTYYLQMVIWFMLGTPIMLMFLLWNLTYLVLAGIIICALFVILWHIHTSPLWKVARRFKAETKKSWRIQKFFDERDIIFESED